MTNEQALESYIHGPDYYEQEQTGIKCCRCEEFIPADERYFEIDGNAYCVDCMDDLYGKTNWT